MALKLPEKLRRQPVVEALFELRFTPTKESVGDVLVGMLYSKLPTYEKIEPLPIASVPREMREKQEPLRYLASHRLVGNGKHIAVGDRVLGFGYAPVYQGWRNFREDIVLVLNTLRQTQFVAAAERYSLKYVNILEAPSQDQLSLLNARFELAGEPASYVGFRLRTERHGSGSITIIELSTDATVRLPDRSRTGLLLTVDTICNQSPNEVLDDPYRHLDRLHETCKATFFGLLTEDAINSMEPVWESESLH